MVKTQIPTVPNRNMKISKHIYLILQLAWLPLIVLIFIAANRVGYVQGYLWTGWQDFSLDLKQIPILRYFWDLTMSFIGILLFSVTCLGVGLTIINRMSARVDGLALGCTAFLLGEIILSIIFLAVTSLGALTVSHTKGIMLVSLLIGVKFLWGYLKRSTFFIRPTNEDKLFKGLILGIAVVSLLYSSARLGYDAVAGYFSHPKIMAMTGQAILFYPFDNFVVSSLHPSILFTAIIQLFGDQSARMLSWINGMVLLLLGISLGRKMGLSSRARMYYTILMLTSTAFVDLLGDGKVELISTAPLLAAVYWMIKSLETPSRGIFLLVGIFTGFGIIARQYNIFLLPVFTVLFYLMWITNNVHEQGFRGGTRISLPVLWMLPPLLTMGAFHLWQNQIWLGSPIAPIVYAQNLDASDWQWQFDPSMIAALRWLYPLSVTIFNTPQSLGNISPLFVGFLPFLLLKNVRDRLQLSKSMQKILQTTIPVLVIWIALFFTVVEIRYVLFLWSLLFLFGAHLMDVSLSSLEIHYKKLFSFPVIVLLIYILLRTTVVSISTYSPIDVHKNARCDKNILCTFFAPLNENATLGDRIFVLHAYRYYMRSDLFACSSRVDDYIDLKPLATQNHPAFWYELYKRGYRYVTFEEHLAESRFTFGSIPDPRTAPEWLSVKVISTMEKPNLATYHLEAINPPTSPDIICTMSSQGTWELMPVSR